MRGGWVWVGKKRMVEMGGKGGRGGSEKGEGRGRGGSEKVGGRGV